MNRPISGEPPKMIWNVIDSSTHLFNRNILCDSNYDWMIETKHIRLSNDRSLNSSEIFDNYRKAALVHRMVRQQSFTGLRGGMGIAELVDSIEQQINRLFPNKNGGLAFPVGVNINNCVAHDSKQPNDNRLLYSGDVVKLDIGVHVDGYVVDSANTVIVDDIDHSSPYNELIDASRDATMSCIMSSGVDQSLLELSELVAEIIGSYEIELGRNIIPIVPVQGIGGHLIERYSVHGGDKQKFILSVPDLSVQGDHRMEEGEVYAIETYASTGSGIPTQNASIDRTTHWMANHNNRNKQKNRNSVRRYHLTELYRNCVDRKGLPFSNTWNVESNRIKYNDYQLGLDSGELIAYPPLYDMANSRVAQVEHTIGIGENGVEIFSLGSDY